MELNRFRAARPLIILIPFGPVDYVFDASDTEGEPLPTQITDPFKATGDLPPSLWQQTLSNFPRDLVCIVEIPMNPGSAGRLTTNVNAEDFVTIPANARKTEPQRKIKARCRLVVNKDFDLPAKYATLVHELAHLYCGHLGTPRKNWWPDRRNLEIRQLEFEAESVCYIVCERLGVKNPSAAYLANYLGNNAQIPQVSIEIIFKVAGLIERMGREQLELRSYDELAAL